MNNIISWFQSKKQKILTIGSAATAIDVRKTRKNDLRYANCVSISIAIFGLEGQSSAPRPTKSKTSPKKSKSNAKSNCIPRYTTMKLNATHVINTITNATFLQQLGRQKLLLKICSCISFNSQNINSISYGGWSSLEKIMSFYQKRITDPKKWIVTKIFH